MVGKVSAQKDVASDDITKYRSQRASAEKNIGEMKKQLDGARKSASRAQDELDHLLSLPPIEEPSFYEDLDMAQRLAGPATSAPKLSRCPSFNSCREQGSETVADKYF